MITFIELSNYQDVFNYLTALVVFGAALFAAGNSKVVYADAGRANVPLRAWALLYALLLILLLGLRPISYAFGDMGNYDRHFQHYALGGEMLGKTDVLFEYLMYYTAQVASAEVFFFICTLLHMVPLLIACQRLLGNYWPLAFFFVVANFVFYGYAVNGIRNGIAASFFLMALSYKGAPSYLWMLVAAGFHKSLLLPMGMALLVSTYANATVYLGFWALCFVVSLLFAGVGNVLGSFWLIGDLLDGYIDAGDRFDEHFSQTGYRMDFVIYSLLPILVGAYFLVKKKVKDAHYERMYSIFLLCNAAWLLLIRLPYSNRFAYLSWFMLGLIIAYPLIMHKKHSSQYLITAGLLTALMAFSLVMNR